MKPARNMMPTSAVGLLTAILGLSGCGPAHDASRHDDQENNDAHDGHEGERAESSPKGPHGGRLFEDGGLAVELAIHETGVPPRFRAWATIAGESVNPPRVNLAVTVKRLGGVAEQFTFASEGDYLTADGIVGEPHSFDADVTAVVDGKTHAWTFSQREGRITLPPEAVKSSGIEVLEAGPRRIASRLELPGQIGVDRDRVAHVVPRLAGVAREVRHGLGARVRRGDLLAVLDSRELADAKSQYLSATKRLELARTTLEREQRLHERRVSAEQDYLVAKQQAAEAEIDHDAARQKLLALGVPVDRLAATPADTAASLTRYELRAPLDGVVIERHMAVGEAVAADADVFVIADLSTLWCDITVYSRDIGAVRAGQAVRIRSGELDLASDGVIAFVGDLVGEQARTAIARVVLPNPDGQWRSGLFVTAEIQRAETEVGVAVSRAALQTFRDWTVVFQQVGDEFEVRPVELGVTDGDWVEVVSGLPPGSRYAAANSFILKAELGKAGATHDH